MAIFLLVQRQFGKTIAKYKLSNLGECHGYQTTFASTF
jgi:hypothetical protein